jgi:hypothetical protein
MSVIVPSPLSTKRGSVVVVLDVVLLVLVDVVARTLLVVVLLLVDVVEVGRTVHTPERPQKPLQHSLGAMHRRPFGLQKGGGSVVVLEDVEVLDDVLVLVDELVEWLVLVDELVLVDVVVGAGPGHTPARVQRPLQHWLNSVHRNPPGRQNWAAAVRGVMVSSAQHVAANSSNTLCDERRTRRNEVIGSSRVEVAIISPILESVGRGVVRAIGFRACSQVPCGRNPLNRGGRAATRTPNGARPSTRAPARWHPPMRRRSSRP